MEPETEEKQDLNLDWFFEVGVGVLGLSETDLLNIRLRELFLRVKGFYDTEQMRYRMQGELTRLQTMVLVNIQLPGNKTIKDPKQLWRYKWEENIKQKEDKRTTEQIIEANQKFYNDFMSNGRHHQQSKS